ncbi:MAG TPA: hypothetical protein VGU68_02160 [Ktedonobacteraceae bacterium]|nr:hypothetical protein [Ktedonobacteraceae bacterium]
MILIMFILLLLALSPLIFQQIYTAVTHAHMPTPIYSPRGPTHNQVMSCSAALALGDASEKLPSFSNVQIGRRCIVVAVRANFTTLYI